MSLLRSAAIVALTLVLVFGSCPCTAFALHGDANDDGVANFLDLQIMFLYYNSFHDLGHAGGDFDENGVTNFIDLQNLLANYTTM